MNRETKKTDLPPDVEQRDLSYPGTGEHVPYEQQLTLGLELLGTSLTFYQVPKLGWVLTTLHISNPSRRQAAGTPARTYGIGVSDSKVYTVGRGPHVTAEVTVHLSKGNLARLQKYVDLWRKGMEMASSIRDRISSRRAQGQLYRSEGRTSWRW